MKTWIARLLRTRPSAVDPLQASDRANPDFDLAWRQIIKGRALIVIVGLVVWVVGIEARLVQLQVVQHERLAARAIAQQQDVIEPDGVRGDILDRNGEVLAYSVQAFMVVADPSLVEDAALEAQQICAAFEDCDREELAQITQKLSRKGRYAVIRPARFVSPRAARKLTELDLNSISLTPESRRYYPKLDSAAHLLGFVGAKNDGLSGIEAKYDEVIRGQRGRVLVQVDAKRRQMFTRVEQAPTAGATVELTIDLFLQHIAERELKTAVDAHRASGGTVIVMDPHTGEILALANYPTYNPNAFGRSPEDFLVNRAVQGSYEPGSTFKMVTASAAIEEGLLSPDTPVDCSPGFFKFPGRKPITEAGGRNYGTLSFEDVIVKSSNVGAVKVGLEIGKERLGRYLRRFGFGQQLGPDFAGESRGQVFPTAELDDSGVGSISMGYQIGVTPLQMATAASAVANGGLLMEPRILRAITRDGRRESVEPKTLRRVISPQTATIMTTIMEGVVQRGTAQSAALHRYQVAGKTGTAAKVVNKAYSQTDYNVSFIGFVPSRRPVYTILVVIDTPRVGVAYGGVVAAPVFKRIAEAALQYAGVPPTINPVAPVIVAADLASIPVVPTRASTVMPTLTRLGGRTLMPDLHGLSARDAMRILTVAGLDVRIEGDGVVVAQKPEAGVPIERGDLGTLRLERLSAGATASGGGIR